MPGSRLAIQCLVPEWGSMVTEGVTAHVAFGVTDVASQSDAEGYAAARRRA